MRAVQALDTRIQLLKAAKAPEAEIKALGIEKLSIQDRLKELRGKQKKINIDEHSQHFSDVFINVACEQLSPFLFKKINYEAWARVEAAQKREGK